MNNIETDVIYWNIIFSELLNEFKSNDINSFEISRLIPFLGNIACELNDNISFDLITNEYSTYSPELINISSNVYKDYIYVSIDKLMNIINEVLSNLQLDNYNLFGISAQFGQWIPGNILINQVKKVNPKIKFVLGGFGSKKEALAFMKNFAQYDYAIWGEGEYPLKRLYDYMLGKININEVPNIIYRINNELFVSDCSNKVYFNLNDRIPDHSDFFLQYKSDENISITIEGGRGCHWNKCKFCFVNTGYRFRTKSVETVIAEIRYAINQYNKFDFLFIDNDIIGNDYERFNVLLDNLIEIKKQHEKFRIIGAEVITKKISSRIIKKMSLAGFSNIQIGYEALSDQLLDKIDKKNSISSNFLFVKWASYYEILVEGANIIRNLLEETDTDILISDKNLHYLRFFIKRGKFQHFFSTLSINTSSRYYKGIDIKEVYNEWNYNRLCNLIPQGYFSDIDKYDLFYFKKRYMNPLWDNVVKKESFYLNNDFRYKIFTDGKKIYYNEYFNDLVTSSLEFLQDDLHWKILCFCNHEVMSITSILNYLNTYSEDYIKNIIIELQNEWLMYSKADLSENVTIINTDNIELMKEIHS